MKTISYNFSEFLSDLYIIHFNFTFYFLNVYKEKIFQTLSKFKVSCFMVVPSLHTHYKNHLTYPRLACI